MIISIFILCLYLDYILSKEFVIFFKNSALYDPMVGSLKKIMIRESDFEVLRNIHLLGIIFVTNKRDIGSLSR